MNGASEKRTRNACTHVKAAWYAANGKTTVRTIETTAATAAGRKLALANRPHAHQRAACMSSAP